METIGLGLALLPLLVLGVLLILFVVLCVWGFSKVLEVMDKPTQGPRQKLIYQLGRVLTPITETRRGKVLVMGEIWDALSGDALNGDRITKDTEVRVTGFDEIDPLVLRVTARLETGMSQMSSNPEERDVNNLIEESGG
jgi:membrane protein implicated in regulation of membrane protease activity